MAMKEKNIKLKDNFNELTIKEYQQLAGMKDADILDVLSVLTDMPKDELRELKMGTLNQLLVWTEGLMGQVTNPVDTGEFLDEVQINGRIWKLTTAVEEMKAGQIIDIIEIFKERDAYLEKLHILMSIILTPFTVKRTWYGRRKLVEEKERDIMKEAEELWNNYPASQALKLGSFFLEILNSLQDNTPASSPLVKAKVM